MSAGFALDDAAWASRWRHRRVADKAVLSFGLLACAVALPPWPGAAATGVAALAVLLLGARVRARTLALALAVPAAFIATGAVPLLLTLTWESGPHVGISPETVGAAASVVVRALAATTAVFVLASTTPMVDVLAALRRARVPDACVEVAGLTYRFVFLLLESAATIREAQAARLGYTDRRRALRSSAQLVGAVLLRSWDRARRLEEGLAGRGDTTTLRTFDPPATSSPRFVAASLGLVALVVVLGLAGPALASALAGVAS
ncbi:cobalt ECF transporter T component CbiQ [Agilicoccus flavus]|uniref:cobalt ECF transporter T component CbiQ n=1 Tax=Agilicoccus flavus TaxID=2775968 RepID=UPI001CF6C853|nr:cobalt ECF transporter T component CbiQ [Agilicoccus flavus]